VILNAPRKRVKKGVSGSGACSAVAATSVASRIRSSTGGIFFLGGVGVPPLRAAP
jgi:hypothetical protein